MSKLIMMSEHGIYVDGEWHVWLPATRIETHGWKSPEQAMAEWKLHGPVTPYLNGREVPWGQNTGGVKVGEEFRSGPIIQRVWFEGDPIVGQLAFDLEAVTA